MRILTILMLNLLLFSCSSVKVKDCFSENQYIDEYFSSPLSEMELGYYNGYATLKRQVGSKKNQFKIHAFKATNIIEPQVYVIDIDKESYSQNGTFFEEQFANSIYRHTFEELGEDILQMPDFSAFAELSRPVLIENGDRVEMYFSARKLNSKLPDVNIYHIVWQDNSWTEPLELSINSRYFDAHPQLSDDGKRMYFVSDRPGGYGETDIYYSVKRANMWSDPVNLGADVNSPAKELFPFIINDLLYFTTDEQGEENFDLAYVNLSDNSGKEFLASPINSKYNELCPIVINDIIYFTSDRPGGCGAYDVYSMPLEVPAYLEVKIASETDVHKSNGLLHFYDKNMSLIASYPAKEGMNYFEISGGTFKVIYDDMCLNDSKLEREIVIETSSNNVNVYKLQIAVPEPYIDLVYGKTELPFFVTGYYIPLTSNNLKSLKMQFEYNMVGSGLPTYVENPLNNYDQYSAMIDESIDEICNSLANAIKAKSNDCLGRNYNINIEVNGFADPRPMVKGAIYTGPNIIDKMYGLTAVNGRALDNDLLSKLRAYFTSKEIETRLLNKGVDTSMITWKIKGKGTDDSKSSLALGRRVDIRIYSEVIK